LTALKQQPRVDRVVREVVEEESVLSIEDGGKLMLARQGERIVITKI
jgi:hypothetical protein